MERKAPRKASTSEVIAIHGLLTKHIVMLDAVDRDDKRLVRYTEGWSDNSIAKTISDTLPANVVARVRVEMFGKLIGGSPESEDCSKFSRRLNRVEDRESELRAVVKMLAEKLGEAVSL